MLPLISVNNVLCLWGRDLLAEVTMLHMHGWFTQDHTMISVLITVVLITEIEYVF